MASRVTLEEHAFAGQEPRWYFVSEGAKSTKIRTLDGTLVEEFATGMKPEPRRVITASEASELGGVRLKRGDADGARQAIEAFDKGATRVEPGDGTLVPITSLRQFYGLLKTELCPILLHREMLAAFVERPEGLIRLVQSAVAQMEPFETDHPLHGERNTELPQVDEIGDVRRTHDLVGFMNQHPEHFEQQLGTYVDYEVSPLNAPRPVFSDGRTAKRLHGGADLLFVRKPRVVEDADASDRLVPVVCEAKIGTDADPFAALIQVLVYATELATRSQMRRLKSLIDEHGATFDAEEPRIAAAVLLINPAARQREMIEPTRRLADAVADGCPVIDSIDVVVEESR